MKTRFFAGLLICLSSAATAQSLRLNELMTLNTAIPASDGLAYGWVELQNVSQTTITLSDYFLSTDSADVFKWQLPGYQIKADSLLLLWLTDKGVVQQSGFGVASDASYLLLTDASGKILDYVPLRSMVLNESYGRRGLGFENEWVYFMQPTDITPGKPNGDPGPWVKVQEHAAFQKGDAGYLGSVVYKDKMWILNYETLTDDGSEWINLIQVWNSADGYNWNLVNANPPYKHGSMVAVFDGYMWAFDGRAFRSSDGVTWEQVSSNTPVSERVVAFKDCLWILQKNSLFRSCDGIVWDKVVEKLPWYPRDWPAFMEHNGRLWMMGGNAHYKSFYDMYFTDVWSSEDGINWELKNYMAPWRGTFWFTYASFQGEIWVIDGGWNFWDRNNPYNGNGNEVWRSADGVNWKKSSAPSNWFQRHAQFTWVFKDELWIAAGFAGGGPHHLYNDVWKYSRKPQPISVEDVVDMVYGDRMPVKALAVNSTSSKTQVSIFDNAIVGLENDSLIANNAGVTKAEIRIPGNDFYKPYAGDITISVAKKDLIVKADDRTINFGQPNPDFSISYSGFVHGDGPNALDDQPGIPNPPLPFSAVGTYPISVSGGQDNNYQYIFEDGALTVRPSIENTVVFPNPANAFLFVGTSSELEGSVAIDLYNSSGNLIQQHVEENFQQTRLDLTQLKPGIYILRVTSMHGEKVRKIVKI